MIEPFASIWPFMATPGNHESYDIMSMYLYNLTYMFPNQNISKNYYTFTLGPVTFISFNPYSVVYREPEAETILQ
jgi:hypothetical protein